LSSYRLDGLGFDAVEHIVDRRKPSFLNELTSSLGAPGKPFGNALRCGAYHGARQILLAASPQPNW
jgi:1,4-alpha-glucan branching enzyme